MNVIGILHSKPMVAEGIPSSIKKGKIKRVVHIAHNTQDLHNMLENKKIDLFFIEKNGLIDVEVVQKLKNHYVNIKIFLVCNGANTCSIEEIVKYSLLGCVDVGSNHTEIEVAMLAAANNSIYCSGISTEKANNMVIQDANNPIHLLTKQQQNIVPMLQKGNSAKEIAAQLVIDVSTVKTHIKNIYARLQVHNTKEMVVKLKNS